jgi:PAS domain S-box-containing protein
MKRPTIYLGPVFAFLFLYLSAVALAAPTPSAGSAQSLSFLSEAERNWLAEHPVIRLAPDPDFPPIESFDQKGRFVGIAADYVELIEEILGLEVEIVRLNSWSEVLENARSRGVDGLTAAALTPGRQEYLSFSDPHIVLPGVIIARNDVRSTLVVDDLHGKKVSIVKGYLWQEFLTDDHPDIVLDLAPDLQTCLKRLSFGEVDAVVATLPVAIYYIEKEAITNLQVAGETGYFTKLSIATRDDWPELNSILQKTLKRIGPDKKDAILNKWIHIDHESIFAKKEFWITLMVIAGVLIIILAFFHNWNRALQRAVDQRTKELKIEIDNRINAETALRESKERYALAVQGANDGLWDWDIRTDQVYYSPRWKSMLGYEDHEIPHHFDEWKKRVHPDDLDMAMDKLTAHLKDRTSQLDFQVRMEHKDGSYRWVLSRGICVRDENGDPVRMAGSHTDITARKEAIQELENSEKKFRTLADTTRAGISIYKGGLEPRCLYANPAVLQMTGYTLEEFISMDAIDLYRPDSQKILREIEKQVEELGEGSVKKIEEIWSEKLELCMITKDGKELWVETTGGSYEIDNDIYWVGTDFDITERKLAGDRIRESVERYKTIFETSGTGMITFGEDSIVTLANAEFLDLTGLSREDVEGKRPWMEFFTEESLKKMREYHIKRGKDSAAAPRTYEADFIGKHDKIHNGIITVNIVPGTAQRVASFLDLTESKQAQRQMYRAEKMAALGQIIAGVAHEINNPNNFITFNLPTVRQYIEALRPILEQCAQDKPELRILNMNHEKWFENMLKLLENMSHGSSRITSIVSELKSYIRSHEVEEKKAESLNTVVEQTMGLIGKQVGKMVKNIHLDVPKNLPLVLMDPGKIEQVLINLFINAGQAADKEDSWIRLTARKSEERDRFVEVVVEDNGVGMTEDVANQIFDPFFTTKGRESGTGLGLAISHRTIEEHGGRITVDSEPEKGTLFKFWLPVYEGENE